jgi:hypothetical protein
MAFKMIKKSGCTDLNEVMYRTVKYMYRKIWGLFSSVNLQKNIFPFSMLNRHFSHINQSLFYRDSYSVETSFSGTTA